ncbi:hypothetical protein JVX91_01595 [Pseudomonas sp. PDNC002]|uniref:hypothetical protein n=1 Tax=Pseudomonas sp. PDNC002 TaxID=2811422 RepID=UPI0019640CA4|nr:hypothetical protein [Pseudomonas sp. PDNC002]QRY79837.1 hypothetical protein JVX91_01595 [Pseudomonas sp. PDNC002]
MITAIPAIRRNWALAFVILIAVAGAIAHSWFGQSWVSTSGHAVGSDDAYISYRYASNFFNGGGLVFNSGEYVEGYSNFLYILMVLPSFLISRDIVYVYSVALNTLFFIATILIFFTFVKARLGRDLAYAGAFLLSANPWMWANVATGLETSLILLVTTALWVCAELYYERHERRLLVAILLLCAVSMLSRVDGFLLPLALSLWSFIRGERRLGFRIVLLVLSVAVFYTACRYFYYHDVIANTFYNKVSGNLFVRIKAGVSFVVDYSIRSGLWVAILGVPLVFVLTAIRTGRRGGVGFAEFFLVLWLGYLVWIGGDIYYERFLVAIMPMGLFVVLKLMSRIQFRGVLMIGVLILAISQSVFALKDGRFDYRAERYDCWLAVGKLLGERYPGATLAVDAAGKIPYVSGLFTIDMLGLNDRHIGKMKVESASFHPGHSKFDAAYVMGRKPDLIAAWMTPSLDLGWDITRNRYEGSYHLKFLVNSSRQDLGAGNIVDVSGRSDAELKDLVAREFNYAVLVRN